MINILKVTAIIFFCFLLDDGYIFVRFRLKELYIFGKVSFWERSQVLENFIILSFCFISAENGYLSKVS